MNKEIPPICPIPQICIALIQRDRIFNQITASNFLDLTKRIQEGVVESFDITSFCRLKCESGCQVGNKEPFEDLMEKVDQLFRVD